MQAPEEASGVIFQSQLERFSHGQTNQRVSVSDHKLSKRHVAFRQGISHSP